MIDETDIVTYRSENAPREELTWMAQVVLPNNNYWGVYFTGSTEQEAVLKAIKCWNAEEAKLNPDGSKVDGRGSHFAGKVWMIHKQTREKIRIDAGQVAEYEFKGYERGGPRSK